MVAEHIAAVAAIIDGLDAVLDWRSPPWNMAEDEAQRDYDRLTRTILACLHAAGFIIVPNGYNETSLPAKGDRIDGEVCGGS